MKHRKKGDAKRLRKLEKELALLNEELRFFDEKGGSLKNRKLADDYYRRNKLQKVIWGLRESQIVD